MSKSCRERAGMALPVLPGQQTLPGALPEQGEGQQQPLLMSILSQASQQELWGSPHHEPCSEMRTNCLHEQSASPPFHRERGNQPLGFSLHGHYTVRGHSWSSAATAATRVTLAVIPALLSSAQEPKDSLSCARDSFLCPRS